MRLNTLILGWLLLAALSGCRSSWSKSEQIMFRTPQADIAMLNPAEIRREPHNCRFSGAGWFTRLEPKAVAQNLIHDWTIIEEIPGFAAFGLPEEFEEPIPLGENPDGTLRMLRIGVGEIKRRPDQVFLDELQKPLPWEVAVFGTHDRRIIQMRQNAPGRYRLVKRIRFPGQNRVRIEGELVNLGRTELRTPVLLHPFYRVFGTQEKPIKKNGTSEFDMDPARPPYLDVETHWYKFADTPDFDSENALPLPIPEGEFSRDMSLEQPVSGKWLVAGSALPGAAIRCDRPISRLMFWHQNNSLGHSFSVEPSFELVAAPGERVFWQWDIVLPSH